MGRRGLWALCSLSCLFCPDALFCFALVLPLCLSLQFGLLSPPWRSHLFRYPSTLESFGSPRLLAMSRQDMEHRVQQLDERQQGWEATLRFRASGFKKMTLRCHEINDDKRGFW